MAAPKDFAKAARTAGRPWRLRFSVGTGALADTNIAIAGIELGDKLISVILSEPDSGDGGGLVDETATSSITSDGNIQSTNSTNGKQVLVVWYDVRP